MGGVLAVFPRKKNQRCLDRKMEENRNSDKIQAVNLKSVEVANILKYLVIPMHFEFFLPFISTWFATSMLSHLWLLDGHSRNPEDLIRTPQKFQNSAPVNQDGLQETLQLLQVNWRERPACCGSCSALIRKPLQRMVKAAQAWRSTTSSAAGRKPIGLSQTPGSPVADCSSFWHLLEGTAVSGPGLPESGSKRTKRAHFSGYCTCVISLCTSFYLELAWICNIF